MSALRIIEFILAAVCAAACIEALCRLKRPFGVALVNAVGGAAALGAAGVIALLILRPIMLF